MPDHLTIRTIFETNKEVIVGHNPRYSLYYMNNKFMLVNTTGGVFFNNKYVGDYYESEASNMKN